MMMPANYSVIAENEMTYVNGGALIDCFAPLMTSSNWKTFTLPKEVKQVAEHSVR